MLRNLVVAHGFTAWLDVDYLFQLPVCSLFQSDSALAAHLNKALDSCRYVLFFETHATLAKQIGGPPVRVTSWQEHELGIANEEKLITLYHGAIPKTLGFGTSPGLHEYSDLKEAFAIIRSAIADPTKNFWR